MESLSKKIINSEAAISFNMICRSEDILPNYTNIYIVKYDRSLSVDYFLPDRLNLSGDSSSEGERV
jgi:hypothetical protein